MPRTKVVNRLLCAITVTGGLAFNSPSNAQACETISSHFGWILTNPITSVVFWPNPIPAWQFMAVEMQAALEDPAFYTRVAEYGVNPGVFGQIYQPTNVPVASQLSESTIQDGLVTMLESAQRVPQSGELFVVFLPQGTVSTFAGTAQGYHNWFNHTFSNGTTAPVVYAVVEYDSDLQHIYVAASHEIYEAYTDPIWVGSDSSWTGLGWWDGASDTATAGGKLPEIADICVNLFGLYPPIWQNKYGMDLSLVYSQANCGCQ